MEGKNIASKISWCYSNRNCFMTERKGKYSLKLYKTLVFFFLTEKQKGNTQGPRKGRDYFGRDLSYTSDVLKQSVES